MNCFGCYKPGVEFYCLTCRKQLFDGARVSALLSFDPPKAENLVLFQERTKQLSFSGVQLKYSLRLEKNKLMLTDQGGRYILKPIPPSTHIVDSDQVPENEHLTMQIASRLFGIYTAPNALIFFQDGTPAYITRRFDVRLDGSKYKQEDLAQISGRSRQTHGEHFKYEGTYEEIGQLIRQHISAYPSALENYFKVLLFNYLFSNGDAHLKNFSLIQTDMGDYRLSPCYDLLSTVLHSPLESDTALDLYKGAMDSPFYSEFGYYGQPDFRMLADKIGLVPIRRDRILTQLLSGKDKVQALIRNSLLSEDAKRKYIHAYEDKIARMEEGARRKCG
ncbi:MAG TPA: HipA domain-containing protein [Puia sp.]